MRVHLPQRSVQHLTAFSRPQALPVNRFRLSRRRRVRCRATEHTSEEERVRRDKQLQEILFTRVEHAAKLLDDIIDDIVCDLSAVQSIGYIYNEAATETEGQIIEKVVKQHLNRLDQNFLASLERFQQKAKDAGNLDVAHLIGKIREEVVSQTNEQFPPEVLLLEDLMKMSDRKDRIKKIREVAESPEQQEETAAAPQETPLEHDFDLEIDDSIDIEEMNLESELKRLKIMKSDVNLQAVKDELDRAMERKEPSDFEEVMDSMDDVLDDCEPENQETQRHLYGKRITPLQLGLAANQFVTDIEEKEEIANRQLLAKLCVIREEARLVEMEMRFEGVQMDENPLKLRENVPSQVMGVVQMLLKTADPIKRVGLIRKVFSKDGYGPSSKDLSRAPGYVRPGIFMTALTMTQMEANGRSRERGSATRVSPQFLQRLDDIRLEAMLVLREMGWGEFSSEELKARQKEREERQEIIKDTFVKNQ